MPCNCSKSVSYQWVYTAPGGARSVYPTQVQANAAKINGGGGTVTREPVR